jgi:peptide-methionine (R)-S-oxide reductase
MEAPMLDRRVFVLSASALIAAPAFARDDGLPRLPDGEIDWASLTNAQWRERLTPEQFDVLRREGTERPGSSPLNAERRAGTYACAGCGLPLFSSRTKYESGTGWPSFWEPLDGAVNTKTDWRLWTPRTEYHCSPPASAGATTASP